MASKAIAIPRYLLPQYGALWRTTARSTALARPLNAELGQVLVRYASKTAGSGPTAGAKPAVKPAAKPATATAGKFHPPKGSSPNIGIKPPAPKVTTTKYSAPTKPPPLSPKTVVQKASYAPVNARLVPAASAPRPAPKTEAAPKAPTPAAKSAAAPPPASKPPPATKSTPATGPSKPIVLEKPERFNPPSHGARLPRSTPKHYGGPMSDAEIQAQTEKSYPGLPPPPTTWAYVLLNNRAIHLFITLGTLLSLAGYTFITNFNAKSPFAELIPPISELPRHPIQYMGVVLNVIKLEEERETALTVEKRRQKLDDVAKRNEYRKAHGLEPTQGYFPGLGIRGDPMAAEAVVSEGDEVVDDQSPQSPHYQELEAAPVVVDAAAAAEEVVEQPVPQEKRKKWLGIF